MHFGVQCWIWPCLLTLFVVFWQLVNYEDWILDPTGERPGWTLFVFTPSRLGMGQFSMTVDDRPPLWLLIFVLPDYQLGLNCGLVWALTLRISWKLIRQVNQRRSTHFVSSGLSGPNGLPKTIKNHWIHRRFFRENCFGAPKNRWFLAHP